MWWIALIVLGVLLLVLIIFLISIKLCVFVVHQAEGIVIERLGKFHRILTAGINFVAPFIDRPRSFTWRKTYIGHEGQICDVTMTSIRIDLRESIFNFLRHQVYTKDTVLVDVNALMYYRITDIKRAIYEIDDLQGALSNIAETQLKEVFGRMTFTEALESQAQINEYLRDNFSPYFSKWGLTVQRMELLDMMPKAATVEVMKRQMIAERQRRAEQIHSEGLKAAMKLKADGKKIVSLNMGVAEQDALRKRSEGEAIARVELARAESSSLESLAASTKQDGSSQSSYMIAQRYIDFVREMADTAEHKRIVLPYHISTMAGIVSRLEGSFGRGFSRFLTQPQGNLVPPLSPLATHPPVTAANGASTNEFPELADD